MILAPRRHAVIAAATLLAGCASASPHAGGDLGQVALFDAAGSPRFTLYLSCAGQVAAETALCWVPSKYFSQWANERHVPMRALPDGAPFDAVAGVPASARTNVDAGVAYRVVVRFAPFATASYSSEDGGMGGYTPPKAGYLAQVYVYAAADNSVISQAEYHKRSDAPYKADAVPYIRAGVDAITAALGAASAAPLGP